MTKPSDQQLATQIRQGDDRAFVILTQRYEHVLGRLISYRIGNSGSVEDVLQETLIHAWSGLRKRSPRDVRAWLLQVARNRCNDYFRSPQRRESPLEDQSLFHLVNRMGKAHYRMQEVTTGIVEAMDEVSPQERDALRAFYLDGWSIREIAARRSSTQGTIKRRLSYGRNQIRTLLGVTTMKRNKSMKTQRDKEQPFPEYRPDIRIEPSEEKPFHIDFKELAWWSIVPELGDRVRWAIYEPLLTDYSVWKISEVESHSVRGPAVIHGRSCVEIEVANQFLNNEHMIFVKSREEEGSSGHLRYWAILDESDVDILADETEGPDGTREITTFLDEGWEDNWGLAMPRVLSDEDFLQQQADGAFIKQPDAPLISASGMFDVHVGGRSYLCLRVFDTNRDATANDVMIEGYITQEGRTLLHRRYNGNEWAKGNVPPDNFGSKPTWVEEFPLANRITIDGVDYIHWYDVLTDRACGI